MQHLSPAHLHLLKLGGLVIVVRCLCVLSCYIFLKISYSLTFVFHTKEVSSSDEEQDNKFLFRKGSNYYKYADLDISEDELYSHGISKNVDIEKTKAIDLLTEKFDFEKLALCQN